MPLPPNMDTRDLYAAIVNDFESAWDAIARDPTATGGGNFMFARQAMTLLEWASRLCMEDASGTALRELGDVLRGREPRYFTRLPAPCADCSEFSLPFDPSSPLQVQLLWALFDLVRHGGAHQYQQITAELQDGTYFGVSATGVVLGEVPSYTLKRAKGDRAKHLGYITTVGRQAMLRPSAVRDRMSSRLNAVGSRVNDSRPTYQPSRSWGAIPASRAYVPRAAHTILSSQNCPVAVERATIADLARS